MIRWLVNADCMTLDAYVDGGKSVLYPLDLECCRSSAEVLDWIAQLAHKSWMTTEDLGSFVRGLDALLGLQTRYCSRGKDRHVSAQEVRERVQRWAGRYLDEMRQ